MHTIPIEIFGREVRIPELSNKDYFNILKLSNSEDLEGLNQYFEEHIFKHNKTFNILDKFIILISLRILCIGRNLTLKNKHGHILDYDLNQILTRVESLENTFKEQIQIDNFTLNLDIPKSIYFKGVDDIFLEIIESIVVDNETIIFNEYTINDKNFILQQLPSKLTKALYGYIMRINEKVSKTQLLQTNEDFGIQQVDLSITNNTLLFIVKTLFTQNMKNYYENMFQFLNKVCQDTNLFYSLTPIESNLFLNFLSEEYKKQSEKLDNNNSN